MAKNNEFYQYSMIILSFILNLEMCTGDFYEDVTSAGNGKDRTPKETKCIRPCQFNSARWASNLCDV